MSTPADGRCACGCGAMAPIAKRTDRRRGYVKGQPTRFLNGHSTPRPPREARSCLADGCERTARHASASYCAMHASRLLRHGTLSARRPAPLDRFFQTVEQDGDCWLWTGQSTHGYGTFALGNRRLRSHRWIYEQMRAEIPAGLHLDHLCRRPLCVNPWHLEPVTNRINVLRGASPLALQAAQTHCKHGHEFTSENTYVDPRGHRNCRTCARAKFARQRKAKKEKYA